MANQQTSPSRRKSPSGSTGKRRPGAGSVARPSGATVERDDTYGLISVIYHSLQGAETCGQYLEDARRTKNEELMAFFEASREEQNRRALRGRRLLAAQLEGLDDEDDDLIEDEDEEPLSSDSQ